MHTGMLWFDNDPRTALDFKIQRAMEYYRKKYGTLPTLCLVNPSMMDKGQKHMDVDKLAVRPYRPVMPGHFWIGVEDQK